MCCGGLGGDVILFDTEDFSGIGNAVVVDGGAGRDTLAITDGVVVDFRGLADTAIRNIEVLDLTDGSGAREGVILTAADIAALNGSRDITINGDAGDVVTLLGLTFVRSDGSGYRIFRGGGSTARVENDIRINTRPAVDEQSFSVPENSSVGASVAVVSASDADLSSGDSLSFAIVGGNTGGAFAIDPGTGLLTVAGALNFETASDYTLLVQVTDQGASDTAPVIVNVVDVNEAPTVSDKSFTIAENSGAGTTVGTVVATDPDLTAPNNSLSYSLSGVGSENFVIDASGAIQVAAGVTLDHESAAAHTITVQGYLADFWNRNGYGSAGFHSDIRQPFPASRNHRPGNLSGGTDDHPRSQRRSGAIRFH